MKNKFLLCILLLLIWTAACIKVKHDMVIQPITVTIEIKLKIEKELNDFFTDIDNVTEKEKKQQETKDTSKEKKDE